MKKLTILLFSSALNGMIPINSAISMEASSIEAPQTKLSKKTREVLKQIDEAESFEHAAEILKKALPKKEKSKIKWFEDDMKTRTYADHLSRHFKQKQDEDLLHDIFKRREGHEVDLETMKEFYYASIWTGKAKDAKLRKVIHTYLHTLRHQGRTPEEQAEHLTELKNQHINESMEIIAAALDPFSPASIQQCGAPQDEEFYNFCAVLLTEIAKGTMTLGRIKDIINATFSYLELYAASNDHTGKAPGNAKFFLNLLETKAHGTFKEYIEKNKETYFNHIVEIYRSQNGKSKEETFEELIPFLFDYPEYGKPYMQLLARRDIQFK